MTIKMNLEHFLEKNFIKLHYIEQSIDCALKKENYEIIPQLEKEWFSITQSMVNKYVIFGNNDYKNTIYHNILQYKSFGGFDGNEE